MLSKNTLGNMSYEPHYISTLLIYFNLFLAIFMCVHCVFNKVFGEDLIEIWDKYKVKKVKKVKKRPRRIWRVD